MKNIKVILLLAFWVLAAGSAFALDADLWNMPLPQASEIVYKDGPAEVNGIPCRATLFKCLLKTDEIMDFYNGYSLKNGWQLKDNFKGQNILAFTQNNRFFYVGVRDNGADYPNDVYLVTSTSDLAICRLVAEYFDAKGVMQQDAPGKDPADIARFPASKRMASILVYQQGDTYIYQAKAAPEEISSFYEKMFKLSGWKLAYKTDPKPEAYCVLFFEKAPGTVLINITRSGEEKDAQSLIIIATNAFDAPLGIDKEGR